MPKRIRARVRIECGSRVKVRMDNRHELLRDMGIVGPGGTPLRDTWMFGTVTSKSCNYFTVKLSAAEEILVVPKEQVVTFTDEPNPPDVYVLFPKKVKIVRGLQLQHNFCPKDYYEKKEDAQNALKKALGKSKKGVTAEAAAVSTAQRKGPKINYLI